MKNVTNREVHVLHDVTISEVERLILCLGLNFIPPQLSDPNWSLCNNFLIYKRNVRIKHYFTLQVTYDDSGSESTLHKIVAQQKSFEERQTIFTPPPASKEIENHLNEVEIRLQTVCNNNKTRQKSNHKALVFAKAVKALKTRNDIIIQESDKKLGTTVMSKSHYILEALGPKHLGDKNTYQSILEPPKLQPIKDKLIEIVKNNKWLNNEFLSNRLIGDFCYNMKEETIKCAPMYFLPKLHKNPITFRPICSSQNSITYNASKYIDIELQNILRQIEYGVRNSTDVLIMLEDTVLPDNGVLISADVVNMYPSIDIQEGILSLRWALRRFKYNDSRFKYYTLGTQK